MLVVPFNETFHLPEVPARARTESPCCIPVLRGVLRIANVTFVLPKCLSGMYVMYIIGSYLFGRFIVDSEVNRQASSSVNRDSLSPSETLRTLKSEVTDREFAGRLSFQSAEGRTGV